MDDSFDSLSLKKLNKAVFLLEEAFNSAEFAKRVSETKFKVGAYGLSSAQILELIKSGKDNYINAAGDSSIDLRIKVFNEYAGYGNFGFTDMVTRITRTHRCYIHYNDVKCYASHLAHEYLHQIGFYDKKTFILGLGTKTKSVPYKIGGIVDDIIGNTVHCVAQQRTCEK